MGNLKIIIRSILIILVAIIITPILHGFCIGQELNTVPLSTESVLSNQASKKRTIVSFTGPSPYHSFWKTLRESIYEQGKESGVFIVDYSAGDFSLGRQKENINQSISDNVDGMIIGPVAGGLGPSLDELRSVKIPVITVDVPINHPWVQSHIGVNSHKAAALAGEYLRDKLKGANRDGSRVVILTGDREHRYAHIRADVVSEIIKKEGFETVIHYCQGWSGAIALQAVNKEFTTFGDKIIGVFSSYAPASVAMVLSAEKHNISPILVGFDLSEPMREMIKNKRLHATIIQDPQQIGKIATDIMVKILNKQEVPTIVDLPGILVTNENINRY